MDSNLVLKIDNLSKRYCLDLKKSLWYGVRDIGNDLFGRSLDEHVLRPDEFWALNNISCELKKGESLGIIGRNGAGKTTILKLINGLIKPTTGKISIRGTIGALIALGTGFNPILTGRENIKIAGAVLGFSGREMEEKLDEILDFSEIDEFIDTPVKNYSSGMLVRLGFAVAIQMKPDLLLVDEVLAVGDLAFAIKCHKKITEYQNQGGVLLLVSHAMHNVRFHCQKAMWIHKGDVQAFGDSAEVIDEYELFIGRSAMGKESSSYIESTINVGEPRYPKTLTAMEPFSFELDIHCGRSVERPIIVFAVFDVRGQHMISNYSHYWDFYPSFEKGKNTFRIQYPQLPLSKGVYSISVVIHENEVGNHLVFLQNKFVFEVHNDRSDFGLLSLVPSWSME